MAPRLTNEQKRLNRYRKLVAEHESSGKTVQQFCRAKKISDKTFYRWRKVIRELDGVDDTTFPVAPSSLKPTAQHITVDAPVNTSESSWVELNIPTQPQPKAPANTSSVKVRYSRIEFEVPNGIDPTFASCVIEAVCGR